MPPIPFTFTNTVDGTPRSTPTVVVSTRERWDGAWILREDLWVNEARWSVSPSMPVASLVYHYGRKMPVDSPVDVARLTIPRHFIRITVSNGTVSRNWYGVIDVQADQIHGSFMPGNKASGMIQVKALGLETLLTDMIIGEHNVYADWLDAAPLQCASSPDFNASGVPNRNLDDLARPAYVFRKPVVGASPEIVEYWSTANIVDYLLAYYVPQDGAGVQVATFERPVGQWLPDFDKPVVPSEGRTAKQIIDALVTRQRGLCWWLEPDQDEEKIEFHTASLSPTAIDLDNTPHQLPAATRQIQLISEGDSSALISIVQDSSDTFDQVTVRGARRTTTLTLSNQDHNSITSKWKESDEDDYNTGASEGTTNEAKQRFDLEYRTRPDLRSVYAWFGLPDDWNQRTDETELDGDAVFVISSDSEQYDASPVFVRFLPVLALEFEADYTSDNTRTEGKTLAYRPILVSVPMIERDEAGDETGRTWHDASSFALTASNGLTTPSNGEQTFWSAQASVIQTPVESIIELRVHGSPQHAIAKSEFVPAGLHDPKIHKHRWQDFLWTVTLEEDRYCEYTYPATVDEEDPLVRRMILDAGEGYRLDRLMKNTVISVKADGTLQTSPTSSFYCRDDRERLEIMARMAYVWYGRQRRAITFSTLIFQPTAAANDMIQLGDLVLSVGDPASLGDDLLETNSTVTEIAFTHGQGVNSDPPPMRFIYSTDFGELDPLQAIPQARPRTMTKRLDTKGLVG